MVVGDVNVAVNPLSTVTLDKLARALAVDASELIESVTDEQTEKGFT